MSYVFFFFNFVLLFVSPLFVFQRENEVRARTYCDIFSVRRKDFDRVMLPHRSFHPNESLSNTEIFRKVKKSSIVLKKHPKKHKKKASSIFATGIDINRVKKNNKHT